MKSFSIIDSPIDSIALIAEDDRITHVHMGGEEWPRSGTEDPRHPALRLAKEQLDAYFAGELRSFNLPLLPRGTEFQRQAWRELALIPYGETISYGTMARRMGDPNACRAVGAANGRNPHAIVVPCHRVIGANGSLVGFGGGLDRKAKLLGFESAVLFGQTALEYWSSVRSAA